MDSQSKPSILKKALQTVSRYAYRAVMKDSPSHFRYKEELALLSPYETRFIELFAGDEEDDICIDLVVRDARTSARFGVLSYVWGPKDDPLPVYIGKHHRQVIYVTKSLDAALRSIRKMLKKGGSGFYWIDALCINQKDNSEKGQQIPLMPLIYPAAYFTYCWLGEADETTEMTFSIIKNCAYDLQTNQPQMAKEALDLVTREVHSNDRRFINGLQRLLRKPWFERAWILQESCRPVDDTPYLVCGPHSMQLLHLWRVVQYLQETLLCEERMDVFGDAERAALNCLEVATTDRTYFTFSYLLETMALRKAENSRDKFFALLGLITNSENIYPRPNYDAPLREVCISYTQTIIKNEQSLAVLQSLRPSFEFTPILLPSWSLDPDALPGRRVISGYPRRLHCGKVVNDFRTTGLSVPCLLSNGLFDVGLSLMGQPIDTIATITLTHEIAEHIGQATSSWAHMISALCDKLADCGFNSTSFILDEPIEAAVARVLTADRFFALKACQRAHNHDHFTEFYLLYRQKITGSRVPTTSALEDKLVSQEDLLLWCYANLVFDKGIVAELPSTESLPGDFLGSRAALLFVRAILKLNLITTAGGRIGLVPLSAAQGDSVVLFPGSTAPLILRTATPSTGEWFILGESYIHGVMSGATYSEDKLVEMRIV